MTPDPNHWLKRHAWALAAAGAVALLAGLALYSPERQKGLAEFQAVGPLRHIEAPDVVVLRIVAGQRQWNFERHAGGWQITPGGKPADVATVQALEMGLRLLRNSPPERSFDADSPDFGLTPAALHVRLGTSGGASIEADFGAANPSGLARYVRLREGGQSALHLMAGYVADPWEQIVQRREK